MNSAIHNWAVEIAHETCLWARANPNGEYGRKYTDAPSFARLDEEVAKLTAERDAHLDNWSRFHHLMNKHGLHPGRTDDDLIEILDTKLDALAKDAARYLLLKSKPMTETRSFCTFSTTQSNELDGYIDAAMKEQS